MPVPMPVAVAMTGRRRVMAVTAVVAAAAHDAAVILAGLRARRVVVGEGRRSRGDEEGGARGGDQ